MNNMDCLEKVTNKVMVCERHGGSIGKDEVWMKINEQCCELTTDEDTMIKQVMDHRDLMSEVEERTVEMFLTLAFTKGTDKLRHGKLMDELENNHTKGQT